MAVSDQDIMAMMAGQQPQQAPADPQQAAAMQAPQPAQQPQDNPNIKTDGEKAMAVAGAKDDTTAEPVTYKVKFGEEERELNEQQIRSTFERYAAMNHKWQSEVAPLKPVLELAHKIMADAKERGIEANPAELAQFMQAATMAYAKNPQMGAQAQGKQQQGQAQPPMSADDDVLKKWEEENAVTLPPGFRESSQKLGMMEKAIGQMMMMMQQMQQGGMNQNQQALEQTQQMAQQAGQQQTQAIRQTIGNNLAMAQQRMQLPDEAEQDFYQFAFSRGYTMEDFIDPQLTLQVANDFKNNLNSPEMDRLRAMAQRRQAFTGMAEGAPGMSGTAPQGSGDQVFDSILGAAMGRMNR